MKLLPRLFALCSLVIGFYILYGIEQKHEALIKEVIKYDREFNQRQFQRQLEEFDRRERKRIQDQLDQLKQQQEEQKDLI